GDGEHARLRQGRRNRPERAFGGGGGEGDREDQGDRARGQADAGPDPRGGGGGAAAQRRRDRRRRRDGDHAPLFPGDGHLQALPQAEADDGGGGAVGDHRAGTPGGPLERAGGRIQRGVHGGRADGRRHRCGSPGGDADREHGDRHRRRDDRDRGDRALGD